MPKPTSYHSLDRQQFEELFRSHFQYLCSYALQYVHDPDTAQDICQRVFIALWEKRSTIQPNQSVKSYLFTAVRNRCLNHIRDHKKYRSRILDLDCGEFDEVEDESAFEQEQWAERINAALSELPDKCRQVFEMSRYQQMKYREIAEELGISQKTVEAHVSKALKELRRTLQKHLLTFALILATLVL